MGSTAAAIRYAPGTTRKSGGFAIEVVVAVAEVVDAAASWKGEEEVGAEVGLQQTMMITAQ